MGLIANYMMVDDETLDGMMEMDDEELIERIEELEGSSEVFSMDKMWDGLHFLLTRKSAGEPIEGNLLSEAVVGIHVFNDDDDAEFIGCSEAGELEDIVSALEEVDINDLLKGFDPAPYRKADIYPDIWYDSDKEVLMSQLASDFRDLLRFYKNALKKEKNVVVSIY